MRLVVVVLVFLALASRAVAWGPWAHELLGRRTRLDLSEQFSEKAPVTKTVAGR